MADKNCIANTLEMDVVEVVLKTPHWKSDQATYLKIYMCTRKRMLNVQQEV